MALAPNQAILKIPLGVVLWQNGEQEECNKVFAEVAKEFSWFKSKFTLDVPGPNDYEITGSFWDHEYAFQRRGDAVATVSKAYWSWSDTYGVDIVDGEDDVAILATVLVIDLVCHEDQT